jgi:hypothetical protein
MTHRIRSRAATAPSTGRATDSRKTTMRTALLAPLAGVTAVAALIASPTVAAAEATVDRVGPFTTVVPVAFNDPTPDNPDGVELMFAECDFVQRVEKPDGSSVETQHCHLTEPFFVFPGTPPERALANTAGECTWFSDYFLTSTPEAEPLAAEKARVTVTPSGEVDVTSFYPPDPMTEAQCDEGPGSLSLVSGDAAGADVRPADPQGSGDRSVKVSADQAERRMTACMRTAPRSADHHERHALACLGLVASGGL